MRIRGVIVSAANDLLFVFKTRPFASLGMTARSRITTTCALLLSIGATHLPAQLPYGFSASGSVDLVHTQHGSGSAKSGQLRYLLASFCSIPRIELFASAMSGSTSYSPFRCYLVQQPYCLGGSEGLRTVDLGIEAHGQVLGSFRGISVSPVGGIASGWTRVETRESQGPTTFCFDGAQIVSCADNPPFATMTASNRTTLLDLSGGFSLARPVGPVEMTLDLLTHHAGVRAIRYGRVQLRLGFPF